MDKYIVELISPPSQDEAAQAAINLSRKTKQDARKILSIIQKGGKIARSDTLENAEKIATLFRSEGLKVRVLEPTIDIDWLEDAPKDVEENINKRKTIESVEPTYANLKYPQAESSKPSYSSLKYSQNTNIEKGKKSFNEERHNSQSRVHSEHNQEQYDKSEVSSGPKGSGAFLAVIVAIVIISVIVFSENPNSEPSTTSRTPTTTSKPSITTPQGTQIDETLAVIMCRDNIKAKLKAPSTAKFPGVFSERYPELILSNNTWEGFLEVDSENSFGAMLRSTFLCQLDGNENTIETVLIE